MKALPYIMLANAVSITIDEDNHVINKTHPNYAEIVNCIKTKQWDKIGSLIDIPKSISVASNGVVQVVNGQVTYNGLPVHSYLATRILELMNQGFDVTPWTNFMTKLYSNPDPYSITQLYEFLERAKLPIHPDGDFLAYKKVRSNYKDIHSGTFDNSVGQKPSQDRATCDNNPNNTCSRGLHFCSKDYLPHFGSGSGNRVMLVKVNPRDVVSIPADHNAAKARACTYEVVGELDEDYTFEDMESSAVLPSPRVTAEVNTPNKKSAKVTTNKEPTELQKRILMSDALTVREQAKNLGITQAEVVNNAGEWYFIDGDGPLGSREVITTSKGHAFWLANKS